jgi:hypothetical protein
VGGSSEKEELSTMKKPTPIIWACLLIGAATLVAACSGTEGTGPVNTGGAGGAGNGGSSTGTGVAMVGGGPQGICASYVSCATATNPEGFGAVVSTYGSDGSCWKGSAELAAQCDAACKTGLQKTLEGYPYGGAPKECLGGIAAECLDYLACLDNNGTSAWGSAIVDYGPAGTCWTELDGISTCPLRCSCGLLDECGGSGEGCNRCFGTCTEKLGNRGPICDSAPAAAVAAYADVFQCVCSAGGKCASACNDTFCLDKGTSGECYDCIKDSCSEQRDACLYN